MSARHQPARPARPPGAVVVQIGRAYQAICTTHGWEGPQHYGITPRGYTAASADCDGHNQDHHNTEGTN